MTGVPGLFLIASALLAQPSPAPDPNEIMRRTVNHDQSNWHHAKDYTYVTRATIRERDSKGNVKKTEQEAHEILILFGEPYEKLIEKDGKPLQGDKLRKEQEKLDKLIAKRQKESEADRKKRLADFDKDREKQREFAREIPKAFSFKLTGEEVRGGRKTWVIDATPRTDFAPKASRAGIFKKFRGTLWIDQSEYQIVRVEAEAIDTVSFGWFLARIAKGTKVQFEQARINDEVWLPKSVQLKLDARIGLIKHLQGDADIVFDSFRKFQTDSKIVATSDAPPNP